MYVRFINHKYVHTINDDNVQLNTPVYIIEWEIEIKEYEDTEEDKKWSDRVKETRRDRNGSNDRKII